MISLTDDPAGILVSFGQALRAHGVSVSPAEIVTFARAVSVLGTDELDDLYWSGRTCLISGHADITAYDAAFASFFLGSDLPMSTDPPEDEDADSPPTDVTTSDPSGERSSLVDSPSVQADAGVPEEQQSPDPGAVASLFETLRHRSFSEWTDEERDALGSLIARIEVRVPRRCTRRDSSD